MKFFTFISLLLISLNSFYFYEFGIALFSIIGYALLFIICLYCLYSDGVKFSNKIDCIFIFYLIIIISIDYIINLNLVRFLSILSIVIIYLTNFGRIQIFFQDIFVKLIIIHTVAFYLQLILFYVFNVKIDYIFPITGEEQRIFDGSRQFFGINIIRPSGLYIEPSTYSTYIMGMILMLDGKYKIIIIFSLISIFLSLSTLGFVVGLLYLLLNSKDFKLIIQVPLYLFLAVSFGYAVDRVIVNSADDYDVFGIRLVLFNEVLSWSSIFGHGMSAITNEMVNGLNVYDAGSGLSFIYFLGLIGYVLFLHFSSNSNTFKLKKVLILSITKMQIFHPFFWLLAIFIKRG